MMSKKIVALLLALVLLSGLALPVFAKTDISPNKPTPKTVGEVASEKITKKGAEITLTAGKKYSMKNHEEGVTYKSTNPQVASISDDGEILALTAGDTVFKRTTKEHRQLTYTVTVEGVAPAPAPAPTAENDKENTPAPASDKLEMIVGRLYQLSNHKAGVTYTTNDDALLTVNKEGVMQAKKAGRGSVTQVIDGVPTTFPVVITAA